jgi:two-component system nitrogen regulation response regulator GlnG
VRQLENLCHWLTVLAPAQVVMVDDLPLEIRTDASNGNSLQPRSLPAAPAASVAAVAAAPAAATAAAPMAAEDWLQLLVREVDRQLVGGDGEVMDRLSREFEAAVIRTALRHTHGRRIEAATKLGVGRNTITRKIQELGLED